MSGENFEKMVEKIARASGKTVEEIKTKVEEKRQKLSGLISEEGAAQVIAAELNINFDNEKFKIDELTPGMRKVNLVAKVIRLFPVREFTTKKGDKSKVTNIILADESSNIRTVLWDTHHIELIEKGEIKEGSVVEIANASMRDNEIHLGSFADFKLSTETLGEVKTERVVKEKSIIDFNIGESNSVRAFIVQAFEPRFFFVCKTCGKKAEVPEGTKMATTGNCKEHGDVPCEKRAVMNVVIDDGTESTRAVMFHEVINSVGITDYENQEALVQQKNNLLGNEMVFAGNVRNNSYFNRAEFIINEAKKVNVEELLAGLENK
jgi:replication factor A1